MKHPVFLIPIIFNVILLMGHGYPPPYEQINGRNLDTRAAISTNVSMADATPNPQIQEITITPPVKAMRANPSRTPKPTPIPPEIPPPTDRRLLHSMILFSVLAVVVVIFGVWINRDRFNMR